MSFGGARSLGKNISDGVLFRASVPSLDGEEFYLQKGGVKVLKGNKTSLGSL